MTKYFLIHNLFVLPLILSQSYFNCKQRPRRNIIFYDKTLLFTKRKKKKGSKAQLQECSVSWHSWLLFKGRKSLLGHNLNLESENPTELILLQSWNTKAPIQHCRGWESKPRSKLSPPVGTSRQVCAAMTVLCIQMTGFGRRDSIELHHWLKNCLPNSFKTKNIPTMRQFVWILKGFRQRIHGDHSR